MRIISGKHKGKRLIAPRGLPVRPTTDFAKESLFNIINNYYDISGLSVMDLYAGTGGISFEFLSRGAEIVWAVDCHYKCLEHIKKMALSLGFDINIVKSDVIKYLISSRAKADIIFADPPYDIDDNTLCQLIELVFSRQIIRKKGLLVIEHSKRKSLKTYSNFGFEKKYGSCVFSFFET